LLPNAEKSGLTHNEGRRVSSVVMRRAVPSICSGGAQRRQNKDYILWYKLCSSAFIS